MPEIVQVVLTDDQALLTSQAIHLALENSLEDQIGEAAPALQSLSVFFGMVAADPQRFPVSGRMASKVKKMKRAAKGPAQPTSSRNKRKARPKQRMSFAKRRRAERRETVEQFNAARERYEQDVEEMQRFQAEAQQRAETLLASDSLTHDELVELFALVGATPLAQKATELREQILDVPPRPTEDEFDSLPKIILPGSAEALQTQIEHKSA